MLRLAISALFLAGAGMAWSAPALLEAPNASATPANQLQLSGNACGPTALLNAFRFGNASWQQPIARLPASNDKSRVTAIIRIYGLRPSKALAGHPRWTMKGVNLTDLTDMANEMTRGLYLPEISQEVLFLQNRETSASLLRRAHDRMVTSLERGLPPIVSLRRYAKRKGTWTVIEAHFVTIKSMPSRIDRNATSFPVSYIDPWGGKIAEGSIGIATSGVLASPQGQSPCLEANFPNAAVGKKHVKDGEATSLTVAALLGRW